MGYGGSLRAFNRLVLENMKYTDNLLPELNSIGSIEPLSQEEVINKEKVLKEDIEYKNECKKQVAMYCIIFLVMILFSRG